MKKSVTEPDPVFKIAKQQVDKLLNGFGEDSSSKAMSDDQVHEVRVCTKKLRALLELYRPCCRKKDIKFVEKRIKALADSYSELRDAHVQYETLSREVKTFSQNDENDMEILLNHYHKTKQNPETQGIPIDPQSGLERILQTWKKKLKPGTVTDIKLGVDFSYRKARQLSIKAQSTNQDKAYHSCRKWLKYYLYQLKMLAGEKISKDKSYLKKLASLGELLGEFHDRCVLEQTLNSLVDNRKAKKTEVKNAGLLMQSWLAEQIDRDKVQCKELFGDLFRHTHNPVKI